MNQRILLRLARLARRRPGAREVRFFLLVALGIGALLAVEHFIGWPDWATVNRLR